MGLQVLRLALTLWGNCHLSGAIPPCLGVLVTLEELALARNAITGTIPPQIGDLTSLKVLYLAENGLTGKVGHLCW